MRDARLSASTRALVAVFESAETPLRIFETVPVDSGVAAARVKDTERQFSRVEDRWLLCAADALSGPRTQGSELSAACRASERFAFDYYMVSRPPLVLEKRSLEMVRKAENIRQETERLDCVRGERRSTKKAAKELADRKRAERRERCEEKRSVAEIELDILQADARYAKAAYEDARALALYKDCTKQHSQLRKEQPKGGRLPARASSSSAAAAAAPQPAPAPNPASGTKRKAPPGKQAPALPKPSEHGAALDPRSAYVLYVDDHVAQLVSELGPTANRDDVAKRLRKSDRHPASQVNTEC